MTKLYSAIPLLLACSLLAACATEGRVYRAAIAAPAPLPAAVSAPPQEPALPPVTIVIQPLDYYAWVQAAAQPELVAERLRLGSRTGAANPVIEAVHLGMLLGFSALATPDTEQEAMELLSSARAAVSTSDATHEYAVFAGFLLTHLQQRAQLREATSSIVETREELETLERSHEQLEQKIEALTKIEQQLIEREQEQVQ